MEILTDRGELRSRELKSLSCLSEESRKRFDQSLSFLQMQGYITTADFVYETDRLGRPYGWGLARYATPEHFFGAAFTEKVYEREPEESRERLQAHLTKLLPQATADQTADRIKTDGKAIRFFRLWETLLRLGDLTLAVSIGVHIDKLRLELVVEDALTGVEPRVAGENVA